MGRVHWGLAWKSNVVDELGFGDMEDKFYDPTMDDRDMMWANKHYCMDVLPIFNL